VPHSELTEDRFDAGMERLSGGGPWKMCGFDEPDAQPLCAAANRRRSAGWTRAKNEDVKQRRKPTTAEVSGSWRSESRRTFMEIRSLLPRERFLGTASQTKKSGCPSIAGAIISAVNPGR